MKLKLFGDGWRWRGGGGRGVLKMGGRRLNLNSSITSPHLFRYRFLHLAFLSPSLSLSFSLLPSLSLSLFISLPLSLSLVLSHSFTHFTLSSLFISKQFFFYLGEDNWGVNYKELGCKIHRTNK